MIEWSTWSPEQAAFVEKLSKRMFAWGQASLTRGTVTDVVAWSYYEPSKTYRYHPISFALIGNGLKFAMQLGLLREDDDDAGLRGPNLDYSLGRALGRKVEHLRYDPHVSAHSLFDAMPSAIGQALDDELPFDEQSWTFIPEPGYPWPRDPKLSTDGFAYWSSKAGKMVHPARPAWLIELPARIDRDERERYGVNPCLVFPSDDSRTDPAGPVMGNLGGIDVMVGHAMHLRANGAARTLDAAIEGVRSCGGLLFPSLSIGPVPATNFGPVVLVANLELVLAGLRPYKKRGRNPVWVYNTDAWTITTGSLMTDIAGLIFDELHGHEDYLRSEMWTLGPPATAFGGPSGYSDAIKTTKQLSSAVKRRAKTWNRRLTEAQFATASEKYAGTDHSYSYCEAKAREVVPLASFPYLIAPDTLGAEVKAFAKGVGYKGKIVYLPDQYDVASRADLHRDFGMWQWSGQVADAVRKLRPVVDVD